MAIYLFSITTVLILATRIQFLWYYAESMSIPKKQREIEELEQAKHNPKLSKIEQQIAEAKLQDIRASQGKYILGPV